MTETKSTTENKGLTWHLGRVNISRKGYVVNIYTRKAHISGQCTAFFWAKIPTTDDPSEHYSVLYRECGGKFMKFRIGGITVKDVPGGFPEKLPDIRDDIIIDTSETARVLYRDGTVYYLKNHTEFYSCIGEMRPPTDDWINVEIEKLHKILVEGGYVEV